MYSLIPTFSWDSKFKEVSVGVLNEFTRLLTPPKEVERAYDKQKDFIYEINSRSWYPALFEIPPLHYAYLHLFSLPPPDTTLQNSKHHPAKFRLQENFSVFYRPERSLFALLLNFVIPNFSELSDKEVCLTQCLGQMHVDFQSPLQQKLPGIFFVFSCMAVY